MNKFLKLLFVIFFAFLLTGCTKKAPTSQEPEPKPKDIPVSDLPFSQLIPHADGYRLDIAISNIKSPRIDYQIIYSGTVNGNPVDRGFGGRDIKLNGSTQLVRNGEQAVVFGSASSGKFKYDEGVNSGTLELVYRDEKGKSVGMAATKWQLFDSSKQTSLSSADSMLKFELTSKPKAKTMFLTMSTMGLPTPATATPIMGPYAILTSAKTPTPGKLTINLPSASPAKLYLYQEKSSSWQETKSTQNNTTLSASVSAPAVILVTQ